MRKLFILLILTITFMGVFAQGSFTKKALYEVFTSSTCPPCATANPVIDGVLLDEDNVDQYTLIKYQMNWPGGGDPYYISDGGNRRDYYNVTYVPQFYISSDFISNINSFSQTMFNNYAAQTTTMDIDVEASIFGFTTTVNIDILSEVDEPMGLKLRIAIVETETYDNATSNGETEFHNVLMKMIPNGNGITLEALTANETMSLEYEGDLFGTNFEELNDLRVVVFVQDDSDKSILQSEMADIPVLAYPPSVEITPEENSMNVPMEEEVVYTFSEPVRNIDDSEITDPASHIIIRKNSIGGEDADFTATINDEKTIITVTTSCFENFKQYYASLHSTLENYEGVPVAPEVTTFRMENYPDSEPTFSMTEGATDVDLWPEITVQFETQVVNSDGSEVAEPGASFTLRDQNTETDAMFTASLNETQDAITIQVAAALQPNTAYILEYDGDLGNCHGSDYNEAFVNFTTGEGTSVSELIKNNINIYPNPVSNEFIISIMNFRESVSLKIYNVAGSEIINSSELNLSSSGLFKIDASQWDDGLYFIELKSEDQVIRKKILVN